MDIETFCARCRETTDVPSLEDLIILFFTGQGAVTLSYHHLPPPGASDYDASFAVWTHGFPADWAHEYWKKQYYKIDPIPKRALSTTSPFWWSEVRSMSKLTRDEIEYLDVLDKQNIGDGIAVPVFGPYGRNGFVGLGLGPEPDGDPENTSVKNEKPWSSDDISRLQRAAQFGHLTYCKILHEQAPYGVKLSAREIEILEWVAKGKSNSVIADIIGISPNTVDTYLRRIFEKLNVSDRVTAALRGLAIGLIG